MGHGDKHSTKSKRHHEKDKQSDRKRKKSRRSEHDEKPSKVKHDDHDLEDDEMWEEQNIDGGRDQALAASIPPPQSMSLSSSATSGPSQSSTTFPPHSGPSLKRDEWMLAPHIPSANLSTNPQERGLDEDFFSLLGEEKKKSLKDVQATSQMKPSSRELNPELSGIPRDPNPALPEKKAPGGPGFQWRMTKLRRVYDTAEEEGRPVDEVALERFESLEAFEEAEEEKRILDERAGKKTETSRQSREKTKGRDWGGEKRFLFTEAGGSGASSRSSSFRRPDLGESGPPTPNPTDSHKRLPDKNSDSSLRPVRGGVESPLTKSHTPIPSVMTPSHLVQKSRALSPSSLNRLQAKVLRAKLMGSPDAAKLEEEYNVELSAASSGGPDTAQATRVQVLPTLDARGRLYDVGHGKDDAPPQSAGNRKKKDKFETRDPKTGEILRYNADDDSMTLGELVRQERFSAGIGDQKNLDAEYAKAILSDGKFENDLDYIDDNAEKLGRKKMRSDAIKRQFAINDYKRTQQALSSCPFCFGEDDSPPRAPVVAMGTRAYLSCTLNEELVDMHCLVVPIQHHLTMLEGDDDVWDEIRNFMKCLMRMFAEQDKGVVFYEIVTSFKKQQHTFIECVPLSWDRFEEVPGYFKESILTSESEWSQHKKLIDFSSRPGGFRRSMVPNLPYFMVQFDYKGEKGYGHVIEGSDSMPDEDNSIEPDRGEFPRYFAAEIIGNMLDLEPRRWRRPRKIDTSQQQVRVKKFQKLYSKFDWTGLIGKT